MIMSYASLAGVPSGFSLGTGETFDLAADETVENDIHAVGSLLKMYFRELPNPLLTYQLYDKFVVRND